MSPRWDGIHVYENAIISSLSNTLLCYAETLSIYRYLTGLMRSTVEIHFCGQTLLQLFLFCVDFGAYFFQNFN